MNMDRETLERRREEIVREHGPWTANNLHLGSDVWTIGPDANGMGEARVAQVTQVLLDRFDGDLSGVRILDLGCYEGAFAVELAQRGAEVLAMDLREQHLAKSRFAKEALGLDGLTIEERDIRDIGQVPGEFDVILCLGVLYHLDSPAAFELLEAMARLTRRLAIVETQVALKGQEEVEYAGERYSGRWYREDGAYPGASVGNARSIWLTRPSLMRAVQAAGFTSAAEILLPVIPELAAYRDHVALIAGKGEPVELRSVPGMGARERWPERLPSAAHPAQGARWRLRERLRRWRGGGLLDVFGKG